MHLSSRHPPPHIARPARAPAHPRPTRQLPNKSTSWRIGEPESWRAHRTLPHFCYRTRYTASPPARHSPAHPSASPLPALGLSPPRRLPAPNGRGAPAHACRAPRAFAGPVSVHPHHQPVPAASSPAPAALPPRPLSSSALTALPRGKPPTPHPYPEPLLPPPPAPRRPVLSRAPALAGLSGQPTPRPGPRPSTSTWPGLSPGAGLPNPPGQTPCISPPPLDAGSPRPAGLHPAPTGPFPVATPGLLTEHPPTLGRPTPAYLTRLNVPPHRLPDPSHPTRRTSACPS